MTPRAAALVASVAAGVIVGVGVPLAELWFACRVPLSEACVWDKALLPVTLAIGAVLGAIAASVAFIIVHSWHRRGRR